MPLVRPNIGAQDALRDLERQGWETLPIAILGMPNLPPAWAVDTWKPIGGCKFTGYSSGTVGNSALRFCLLLKWRAIPQGNPTSFQARSRVTALAVVQGTLEIKPGVRPLPQAGAAPHRQLVPLTAASLPRRLLRTGGGSKGHSVAARTHRYGTLLA